MLLLLHEKYPNNETKAVMVNMNYIVEITSFSDKAEIDCYQLPYFEYLRGSSSTLWRSNWQDRTHVVETIDEIHKLFNGNNK